MKTKPPPLRPAVESIIADPAVLRDLLDHHVDGVAVVVDGLVAYANPALCRMTGLAASDLFHTSAVQHVAEHDRARAVERLAQLAAGDEPRPAEYDAIRRDGTTFRVEIDSSWRVSYEGRPALLMTIREQTERQRAPKALEEPSAVSRASELKFRTLFEQAPIGITLSSPDGRFIQVNRSFCQMLGYDSTELVGRSVVDITHQDDAGGTDASVRRLLADAPMIVRLEKRYQKKDGEVVHAQTTVSVIRDEADEVRYVLAMVEDLTERRQIEEQLEQSIRVGSVGQLAAGVAHNFNNALMAISGFSELIAARVPEHDLSRRDLAQIQQVAATSANLTNQLLAFSRKERIEPTVFCPNDAVQATSDLLGQLLGGRVKIQLDLDPDLPNVRSDRSQLEQVVTNLVLNARDAMPTGGQVSIETGAVTVDDSHPRVHVDAKPGRYVRLVVSDTGCGMDVEVSTRVFEPFFTTKEQGEGVGLGLSMVHGTVTNNGGFVTVKTAPGAGSSFSVYLPALP